MEWGDIVSALAGAGGYALLCGLMIWVYHAELGELRDALGQLTAAVTELRGFLAGAGGQGLHHESGLG